jgi:hypothetical protein
LVIVLVLDPKLTAVTNNGGGKMRGAVMLFGELMKSAAVKMIDVKPIKSASVKRSGVGLRSAVDWMKTAAVKPLAFLRGWLVNGPWKTNGARRKSSALVIAGCTDLRCCLVPRLIWRI